jgi:predicted PhzF superfamily epimerase YddE/YHI9
MSIPIFQVDAFTDQPFAGTPAAVCILQDHETTPGTKQWLRR